MANGSFLERLRGQLFRESLGEELDLAKRNRNLNLIVRYGGEDHVYARITIGVGQFLDQVWCGKHALMRSDLHRTVNEYVREGHERFFDHHNLNENHRADSYFVLYKSCLCDLKAVARIALELEAGMPLVHSPQVANALHNLGYTYVHFSNKSVSSQTVIRLMETTGQERDGLRYGRSGEGKNHRRLRKWVKRNPNSVLHELRDVTAKTEVPLLSGDRVDVVYYTDTKIIVIEVKSRDSSRDDLLRGLYQSVKYEAVMSAQLRAGNIQSCSVSALLVTECGLPSDLRELADTLNINCRVVAVA